MVMLGGLQAALKAIGTWPACSGWVEVLSQAVITTTGRAESLINCAHITCRRYAPQVINCSKFVHSSETGIQEVRRRQKKLVCFPRGEVRKKPRSHSLSTRTSRYNLSF